MTCNGLIYVRTPYIGCLIKDLLIMKKIIFTLFSLSLFLSSCSNDEDVYYNDMYLSIEVVDDQGNDLLGSSSSLIHQGETKVRIGNSYYYLDSQENNSFTFRHIQNDTRNYIKIGCWYYDREDLYLTIYWGGDVKNDVLVFSYDSPNNGLISSDHDSRYPYRITVNGKNLDFDSESGRFIYVKDIK